MAGASAFAHLQQAGQVEAIQQYQQRLNDNVKTVRSRDLALLRCLDCLMAYKRIV